MEFDRYLIARGAAMAMVVLGLVLGIAYRGNLTAVPPVSESSGALEAVLLAKPVLIAVRVGVMGLAIYAAASIVGLVIEGRWLVKAGISGAEAEPSVLALGYQEETSYRFTSIDAAIEELREAIDEMEERVYEEDAE